MEINEFIEKFAELFDETDVKDLKPETKFRELDEWSSLTALGLLGLTEEEFDVALSSVDMRQVTTIQELLTLIESKQ